MPLPSHLLTLAHYMAGEFDNRDQAIAEPVWYVHLRLWQCPVPLFSEDSVTLFAEQAAIVNLGNPYRQRIMRLQVSPDSPQELRVQYYGFKDPGAISGAGQTRSRLTSISVDEIELLPGCLLNVTQKTRETGETCFIASPPAYARCYFTYQAETRQVALGFEANAQEFLSYDKGIDPNTGRALWGAMIGSYRYTKRKSYEF